MRKFILLMLCGLAATTGFARKDGSPTRPRLVVGLVIDQMRWDYLYRYYDRFGNDGFKRLMREGFNCQNASINYLPSFTAPGHACIYTGSVPAIHGITGNNWIDTKTGRSWYCTEDTTVAPVGGSLQWGRMSPRNMMAGTITDELRLATRNRSRVYGISLKDRGSILPAGHLANGAYWFDDSTGYFSTSSYYETVLPAWLQAFNQRRLPDSLLKQNWQLRYPAASYVNSLPDNNPYEGKFQGEQNPVFPHITAGYAGREYNAIRRIPAGNTLTLEMARACISGNQLGRAGDADFLCLSLSATDYIGHQYGPDALETEDLYIRLDEDLAAFLKYLDQVAGAGNYLLFLTADHGAARNASFLKDQKMPAGSPLEGATNTALQTFLKSRFGKDLPFRFENYQVYADDQTMASLGADREKVLEAVRLWFLDLPGVDYVTDPLHPGRYPVPEPLGTLITNGWYRQRSGLLQVIYKPGWYSAYAATGTTHGTWNPYDTHIPLLWYGWHIPKGESYRDVQMTDITATLAALLHLQAPNGCVGKVIPELLAP